LKKVEFIEPLICIKCQSIFIDESTFCKKCGHKRIEIIAQEKVKDYKYKANLKQLIGYSIVCLVLLSLAALTNDSYQVEIFWTIFLAIIDISFAHYNRETFKLITPKYFKIKPLFLIIGITICSGFFVYFVIAELNIALFGRDISILSGYSKASNPLILAIVSYAIFPAIFEELAFRGFLFNNLNYLSGKKAAIIGSAFLFTLVHFSILSFFWLFPFGLLLAYFRSRYNTLIYGMIGHFTHNFMVIMLEYNLM